MIIAVGFLFIVLMSAPLLKGVFYYRRNEGEVLAINQDKIKDPRYFGKSFADLVERNLNGTDAQMIKLSQKEEFIDANQEEVQEKVVDKLVVARENFMGFKNVAAYKKEIYAAKDLVLDSPNELLVRAAYSKGNMIIGSNTDVIRWLDAEGTLAIHDHCDLGISASSATRMSIGENCTFRRLYSPEIQFGQYPGEEFAATDGKNPMIYKLPVQRDRRINIKQITDKQIDKDGIVNFTLFSSKNVYVPGDTIVQGDVRSDKAVNLRDGSTVCGNIFAEGDIHLGKNASVLGNVFSQGSIYLDRGAVVGQPGRIVSVIAREKILTEKRSFIFGFVSCEKEGSVIPSPFREKIQRTRDSIFLEEPIKETVLEFEDVHEYETLKSQNFRYHHALEEVTIPNEATSVPKSMFYHSESLRVVNLPEKLVDIGAYSFSQCNSLRDISLAKCLDLKTIGFAAFEECTSLEAVTIPSEVETIGAAAFSGCKNIKSLLFTDESKLRVIGDHCFNGCEALEEIHLGRHVEKIGISAFKDCFALKKIVLPETCRNEPGVSELPIDLLEFYQVSSSEDVLGKDLE